MKILSRILPPKMRRQETEAKTRVHRRVEVTVDRETVSIRVPGQRRPAEDETVTQERGPVEQLPELTQAGPALPQVEDASGNSIDRVKQLGRIPKRKK